MRTTEILELFIYVAFIGYCVSMQSKLSGRSAGALEFQKQLAEKRKTGKYSLSTDAHKKLNWLGISAGVLLCAITIFNAFKK